MSDDIINVIDLNSLSNTPVYILYNGFMYQATVIKWEYCQEVSGFINLNIKLYFRTD